MTADGGRRDADPFADYRSGGTSVRPDDRLEVETHHPVSVQRYQASPPRSVLPQPVLDDQPRQVPERSPAEPSVAAVAAPRPKTRREAREAEARGTGQQQPLVVPPRRPESPPQSRPMESEPDDTQPQQVQRIEVHRYEPGTDTPGTSDTEQDGDQGAGYAEEYGHHDDLADGGQDDHPVDHDADADEQHDDQPYYHDDVFHGYHDGYDDDDLRAEHVAMEREGKRRKARGPRRFLVLLAVLLAVGLGSYAAWVGLQPAIQSVRDQLAPAADFAGPGTGEASIRIEEGDTGKDIGQKLYDAEVVASVEAFNDAAKANPDWVSVQFGDYVVPQQLPAADAVLALLDEGNKVVNRVTVNAGWRTDQVLQAVAQATGTPYEQVLAAALALPLPEGAALPPDAERAPSAIGDWEGWFLPYTYDLGLEPTPENVLTMMRDRTVSVLDGLGVAPADRRAVLTKASLIQAEGLPQDYGMVARVIENRIASGVPLQNGQAGPKLLQFDSTTNYATGLFDAQTTSGQRETPSPYNTYYAEGLPPGPINAASLEAIEAAISPTPGPWLFFVSVNLCTGETRFAQTLAEHEGNKTTYQEWLRANPKGPDGKYPCG